jgi:tape measure domain-containing protein
VAEAVVRLRVDASGATRALNGVQNQTNKLQNSFNGLRSAILASGVVLVGRQAVKTSANFEKLNVRLGLLTKSSADFAKSQQIAADAQKAFGLSAVEALEGVTDITARLAPLGTSVEDIRTVFFGFNTAAKLAGASAIESSNAFRQLAQALGSGRLAGDEFRSVSEQVPTVLAPIAEELGVTIGELKKLAAEGKLTSDVVLRALGRVGNEGSGFLKELLKNDPTQVFKNFSNATEDLSRAFGDELRPAVENVTKLLTDFIVSVTEFVKSDAGQAAIMITKIAGAAKLLAVGIPLVTSALTALLVKINMVGVQSLIASGGFTGMQAASLLAAGGIGKVTLALGALKIAIATTGIGLLVVGVGALATKLVQATRNQKEFNKALKDGNEIALRAEMAKVDKRRFDILKRLATAEQNNNKRAINSLTKQLNLEHENYKVLRDRLNEEIKKTNEIDRQNEKLEEQGKIQDENKKKTEELKEKMTEVGEEIESSIKNNLRESITGAQSFGQAMTNVLNKIRDKIIDAQIDKLLGQFGENFGSASTGGQRKGIGGFLGGFLGGLFRANGGPVKAGQPYIVGERQPELFIPRSSGTILPSVPTGGGGTTNNMITVNVDASGTSVQGSGSEADQLGGLIASVVQATIIDEQRSGGLLNR